MAIIKVNKEVLVPFNPINHVPAPFIPMINVRLFFFEIYTYLGAEEESGHVSPSQVVQKSNLSIRSPVSHLGARDS